ncbi:hypothetical protein [Flavobacterium urumqiense]|uniref:Uncharacterized protein n=1 Tax=Flavobacterium urumqiense TaxID=935224 RepID=A0A1H5X0V1_9FLAO|nr:hypothetical protein [Flavobacterium urumqiense]SEG05025.1 hypothetical protein SAMN04488130_105129 [Flavobacterium urumqiense]
MQLDELKNTWDNPNNPAEQKQHLTTKMIEQMTQKKYNSKIKKIAYPEIIGVIICLISVLFIGINFYKLDTTFLQGAGIVSVLLLATLSILSLLSLRQLTIPEDVNRPYAATLKIFATQKLQFFKLQKINAVLSYLLLVSILILMSKYFDDRDITGIKYFWIYSFSFGYLFLLFYSKWVAKYYKKTVKQSEELLQDLQQFYK